MDKPGSLLIESSRISWLGGEDETPSIPDYDTLDASGLMVCPGFIDMHCHLRQPGYEDKETIASGSQAAAKGGFTTICCMPNTKPPLDNRAMIDYVNTTAATEATIRVLPVGCITKNSSGKELAEMGEMADAGAVAFSDDGLPAVSSRVMRQAMEYSLAFGLPIIDHCEDTSLSEGGFMNEGIVATRLGLCGIPTAAEENIVSRDIALAEFCSARLHIAHASTAGTVELVRQAKQRGVKVTTEVTPHHLTLTEDKVIGYDTNAKVNPPLRTKNDVEALIRGLKENVIDIIATDHAPHTDNDKLCEFSLAPFGISSFETALGSLMSLVHDKQIDLNTLIAKLTSQPAEITGVKSSKLGMLATGAVADITIFDPDMEWTVYTGKFVSKGKNNPLNNEKLKGKVMATIYKGKFAYKDESLTIGGN
jgi:dihydroorotase